VNDFWSRLFGSGFDDLPSTASPAALAAYDQRNAAYNQWLADQRSQSQLAGLMQQQQQMAGEQLRQYQMQQMLGMQNTSRELFDNIDRQRSAPPPKPIAKKVQPVAADIDLDPRRAISLEDA
jgi:hypothetical protein